MVVVGFISQKGGVGKSTLARALAAVVAHAGMRVRIIDLDPEQSTVVDWEKRRGEASVSPPIEVAAFASVRAALASAREDELLLLDAPAGSGAMTRTIAEHADIVVQPSSGSLDDLRPAVLLFHGLLRAGVPAERLVVALCRTHSADEEALARAYFTQAGYHVLAGALPEKGGYRDAHNRGHAATESRHEALRARADELMESLLARITHHLEEHAKRRQS